MLANYCTIFIDSCNTNIKIIITNNSSNNNHSNTILTTSKIERKIRWCEGGPTIAEYPFNLAKSTSTSSLRTTITTTPTTTTIRYRQHHREVGRIDCAGCGSQLPRKTTTTIISTASASGCGSQLMHNLHWFVQNQHQDHGKNVINHLVIKIFKNLIMI